MTRKKFILFLLFSLGTVLALAGIFILVLNGLAKSDSNANVFEKIFAGKTDIYEINGPNEEALGRLEKVLAESADDPRLLIYRLILTNEIYHKADRFFWEFLAQNRRPTQSKIPDLGGNAALYEKYLSELDQIILKSGKALNRQDFLWQAWNNRGNAKVYQIFLGFMLKEDSKKLEKLVKSALADYVKAYENCSSDKDCVNFVGQNIDFLTRIPPPPKQGKEEGKEESRGGGLGELFKKGDAASEDGNGLKGDGDNQSDIILPGTSPGKSIKGAH